MFAENRFALFGIRLLENLEIFCAGLAAHLVGLRFKRNLLSFGKAGETRTLDRADVNEHIVAAVARLNETEAFLAVEPLHSTSRHVFVPCRRAHALSASGDANHPISVLILDKEPKGALTKAIWQSNRACIAATPPIAMKQLCRFEGAGTRHPRNSGKAAYIGNMTKPPSLTQADRNERMRLAKETGAQARAEIEARDVAVRKNMERLRALRLAREAEEALKPKPEAKPARKAGAKKTSAKPTAKSLSDWIAAERAAGRKT